MRVVDQFLQLHRELQLSNPKHTLIRSISKQRSMMNLTNRAEDENALRPSMAVVIERAAIIVNKSYQNTQSRPKRKNCMMELDSITF